MSEEEGSITLGEFRRLPLPARVMMGLVFLLIFFAYFFFPVKPVIDGHSLGGWAWEACNSSNGFLHGRLVVLIFPVLIWVGWMRSKGKVMEPSYWGGVWLVFGFLLFWAGLRVGQPRWVLAGAPLVVVGLAHDLFGWRVARSVLFPAFFLWFAIPIPGLEVFLESKMRVAAIDWSVGVGNFFGMGLEREGLGVEILGSSISFSEQ